MNVRQLFWYYIFFFFKYMALSTWSDHYKMIGVRVFLYIMYNVFVVLNTSLLAARFCNIKKSKRERRRDCCVSFCLVWIMRKKPRVQSITLAPHNSRVTATLISHAAELKIDLTAWQSIMPEFSPYGMDDKTKTLDSSYSIQLEFSSTSSFFMAFTSGNLRL